MRPVVLLLVLPIMLWSQPEFYGYFESEADVMQVGGRSYYFGYNKMRLDVEARPSDNVLIGANINIQQYWGQTTWNLLDFLPVDIWQPIFQPEFVPDSLWVREMSYTISDTLLLDNIYMRVSFPFIDLTLGRQQVSPGVGYAWNPTDIFNTKTLLDPSYEQTGISALRAELPITSRTTASAVLQPEDSWEMSTKQVFLKTGLGSFDFELTAAQFRWERSFLTPLALQVRETQRTLVGGSFVGELFEWGLWAEGAYNELEGAEDFLEVIFGTDHTFDNSVYLLLELLHNENGIAQQGDLTFDAFLQSLGGETHSLMQDYAFVYLMHQTFDYVSLSAIAIANLNDQSGTFGPQLDWNVFEDTNLSFQSSFSWGDDDTEFGLQDWGFRIRILSNF
ncbi:MAG: hypothetical protein L3J79_01685 [Candidatus Marinimicrobia bacterium]|nr:hypothetical protein [Candidatus Neomarinimicrobiota bacterium]